MNRRYSVTGYAASELDIRVEAQDDCDDADTRAVLSCWDGKRFTVQDGADVHALLRGLADIANGCGALADEHRRNRHPEGARAERAAEQGLSTLMVHIARDASR